jgi:hypothetical protein
VESALDEKRGITEAGSAISSFASLVWLLEAYEPKLFGRKNVRIKMHQVIDLLLERGDSEMGTSYFRSDWDKDRYESEADEYKKLSDAYEEVAALDVVSDEDEKKLDSYSSYFKSEADSLEEEIAERFSDESNPMQKVTAVERDSIDEDHSTSIKKLFEDL